MAKVEVGPRRIASELDDELLPFSRGLLQLLGKRLVGKDLRYTSTDLLELFFDGGKGWHWGLEDYTLEGYRLKTINHKPRTTNYLSFIARSIRRWDSRSAMSWRLSCSFFPRPSAISIFARPRLK